MLNQPLLTRLFTAGSLTGMINLMQGEGIAVEKLEVPFSSRNGVISVHDAKATGPSIGVTADGYIDRPKNDLALKGTLVPMFGLNNMLGNIPVLGDVLISKQGEGVFGMTYSATRQCRSAGNQRQSAGDADAGNLPAHFRRQDADRGAGAVECRATADPAAGSELDRLYQHVLFASDGEFRPRHW